jgi:hypothetical protein
MIRILSGIVLGALTVGIGGIAAALTYGELAGVSQFEGAFAMSVIFGLGPLAAFAGAIIGGVLGARSARRVRTSRGLATTETRPGSR